MLTTKIRSNTWCSLCVGEAGVMEMKGWGRGRRHGLQCWFYLAVSSASLLSGLWCPCLYGDGPDPMPWRLPSSANTQFSRAVCMQRLSEGVLRFPCDDKLYFWPQWHRHQQTSFTSTITSGWGSDRVIKEPNTAPILLTAPALSVTTYQPGTRTMVSSLLGSGFVLLPTRQASFLCRVQIYILTICYWKVGLLSSELLFSNDSLS